MKEYGITAENYIANHFWWLAIFLIKRNIILTYEICYTEAGSTNIKNGNRKLNYIIKIALTYFLKTEI